MDMGLRWAGGPSGPSELITYVECNGTNDLISEITAIVAIQQERTI